MTDHFAGDPRTNRERMLAGDLYIADDPESSRIAERGARLADAYYRAFLNDPDSAIPLLAELLGELGEDAVINTSTTVRTSTSARAASPTTT